MIRLEPYNGNNPAMVGALIDELNMNVYFDDVDASTCRFCFQENLDSPMVDYDIPWEVLESWHSGINPLELVELPHDSSRFAEDMNVFI